MSAAASDEWEDEWEASAGLGGARDDNPFTGLSLGFLAMTPLFLAYEWGLAASPGAAENTGRVVLGMFLRPLGSAAPWARWILLAVLFVAALARVRALGLRVRPGVARTIVEGAGFALLLGPALVFLQSLTLPWLPPLPPAGDPTGGGGPALAGVATVFGGAAWEELLFRVGVYSFLYWLTLRFVQALGGGPRLGRPAAEVIGLLGSALAFAMAHMAPFLVLLGGGGHEFDASLFTWLTLAGILLGLLFRLRGPGVGAWTHGLFNAALWIGIDPDVLL